MQEKKTAIFLKKGIDKRRGTMYNITCSPDVRKTAFQSVLPAVWGHSSAGRASALQAEGHRFEPCCTHQYGQVAQLVRAPACHAGGRGFEPHSGRHPFLGRQGLWTL